MCIYNTKIVLLTWWFILCIWPLRYKHRHCIFECILICAHFLSKVFKPSVISSVLNSEEIFHLVRYTPLSLISGYVQSILGIILNKSTLSVYIIHSVRRVSESVGGQWWSYKHNSWYVSCVGIWSHRFKLVIVSMSVELSPNYIGVAINDCSVALIPWI